MGLKRQIVQIISFLCACVIIYIFRGNLLSALAAGFHAQGLASRVLLLLLLLLLWFIIHRLLAFLTRPLMKKKGRLSGTIFAIIKGLVTVIFILMLCDLAYPTLELRLPKTAEALSRSTLFRCVRRFDESRFNPLIKYKPLARMRDVFLAHVDYATQIRLEDDPNYRALQSMESLSVLKEDNDFQKAIKEGHYWNAVRNPKLRTLLNDEEAYLAFKALIRSGPEAKVATTAPGAGESPPPTEEATQLITLKNGKRLRGIIRTNNDHGVTADIIIEGDFIRVTFWPEEIREIRDIN